MLVTHVLLAASAALLFGGGVRLASRLTDDPLQRLIAGATLAAAAAVIESLALGLVGLGTTPAALSVAALTTGLAAWRLVPRASVPVPAQLTSWWSGLPTWSRVAAGAAAGSWLAWTLWLL